MAPEQEHFPTQEVEVVDQALSSAPTATPDVSANPTPAYLLRWGYYVDWISYLPGITYPHFLPYFVLAWQIYSGTWLTWRQALVMVLWGYFKLVLTFGVLHRFFSHKTYSASRPVAFGLGLIAAWGGQRGGLWWGSKHVRHHKFCENVGDPHSAIHFGMFYAFLGWVIHPCEMHIDWDFVHAPLKVPEMLVCEALASWVPYLESYLLYNYVSPEVAVMGFWATAVPVYITLLFNVGLHHDPEVDATPLPNGKYRCRAHDKLSMPVKVTLDLIGELDHYDHHRYPRKALHPSASGVDLTYWGFIYPGEKLGLFYDVNYHGVNSQKRRSRKSE
jgi:fatty-acid desaturase